MKITIKHTASLFAKAISGVIVLASFALAATDTLPVPHSAPAPSPSAATAPEPAPYGTGVDPLVPSGGGANPYVPYYPGMDQAF
jgi:hypothetical protein